MLYTFFALFGGLLGFQLGSLRVGLDLMRFLPADHEYRSWGIRISRHDGKNSIEVGWIGRAGVWLRRPVDPP